MIPNVRSITLESNSGILREIKTEAGVCPAFNPLSGAQHPEISNFICLWDTGASGTVISSKVVEKLGLKPISKSKVFHANGESVVNVYAVNIFLLNSVGFQFIQVTEGVLAGIDVLLGMDIITMGDFSITNANGKTMFSFRIPSIKHIDYTTENKGQVTPPEIPKVSRNSPCHCGSGKKYKACHGK